MNTKTILYIFVVPIVLWALESLNIDRFFKKGRVAQIRLFYLILCFGLSYLITNFFYDFFLSTQIVSLSGL